MYASGTTGSDLLIGRCLLGCAGRQVFDGIERLLPSPAAEHLCQNAEGEGEQHPGPVHLLRQDVLETHEILASVHPIQDGPTQEDGEDDLGHIGKDGFHFHGCKDTNKRAINQMF